MSIKAAFYEEMKQKEDKARNRINNHRSANKANISQNKNNVFQTNRNLRENIKEESDKIRDII